MGAKEDKVVKLNGQTGRPLLWFDQCPPELQFNRYIRSGYRAGYTCRECVASIFQYHNETGAADVAFFGTFPAFLQESCRMHFYTGSAASVSARCQVDRQAFFYVDRITFP